MTAWLLARTWQSPVGRAKADVQAIKDDLMTAMSHVRQHLQPSSLPPELLDDWATIETFCAISLRVMAQTNTSKIRSAAVTTEISALIPPVFALKQPKD